MLLPFFQGMSTGGGLIVAIGAQNAFVLSQSVRRNHHLTAALICMAADILLISLGVSGVGTAIAANAVLQSAAAWGGAAFLCWYGISALRSALRPSALTTDRDTARSLRSVVLTTLAVTFLNPHFYLDTLILLGSISAQYPEPARPMFGMGAMTASVIWFVLLSLGGQALAPLFARPSAWRVLDCLVGTVMFSLAAMLVRGQI
ncbi:MAG TPA: LysE/ArgO family amino acid transporter [Desulfomicrobiaceae bacterium]|nr:LysE/ArgO family amino acid transporter [Desulfomicrobiaceae bacterium]